MAVNKIPTLNDYLEYVDEHMTNEDNMQDKMQGESKVRYGGSDKPILSCGARVVIETTSDIVVDPDKLMNEPDPSRLMEYLSKV